MRFSSVEGGPEVWVTGLLPQALGLTIQNNERARLSYADESENQGGSNLSEC